MVVVAGLGCWPALSAGATEPAAPSHGQNATAFQMTSAHTGYSGDPTGPSWTSYWSATLGGPLSYPVIAQGEIFVVGDSNPPSVYALNAATGHVNWQVAGTGANGITYDAGVLFAQDGDLMSAYDASTGTLKWSATLAGQWVFSSAPTASGGIVYTDGAGSAGTVYALSEATGALLWTAFAENGDDSSPAVSQGRVLESYACDLTQAYEASTGTRLWMYYNGCEGGGGQTSMVADGNVYLRDRSLNVATGQVSGSLAAGPIPAADSSTLYTEAGGTLRAQSVASGTTEWSFAGDGKLDSAPIVDDGVVYEGSASGELYGVSAASGKELWSTTLSTPISAPSVNEDSYWGLAEGDDLLVVPSGSKLSVFHEVGAPPATPTNVSAAVSGTSAVVKWVVPAAGGSAINSFTIRPSANGVPQTPLVVPAGAAGSSTSPTPGASDSYTVTGLATGKRWTFSIAAGNNGGRGAAAAAPYAPYITSPASTVFAAGLPSSFRVKSVGLPTPKLSESGALPAGVSFKDNGNGTATLSGTPAAGTIGVYSLAITASNGVKPARRQAFKLSIDPPIAFTSAASTSFDGGLPGSFTVTASGAPAPTFTEKGLLPPGVSLSTAGVLSGTAPSGAAGAYPFTITASNGVVPDATQNFVLNVDSRPEITSVPSAGFTLGQASSFTVTASGVPAPTITESGPLPAGISFAPGANGTATLAGTPAPGTDGVYRVSFSPVNAVGPGAAQDFTLTVGTPPLVTSAADTTFAAGAAGTFQFTATGYPVPSLSESGALPSGVTFSPTGLLSGTPAALTGGAYAIVVTAANGLAPSATQDFTLYVDAAPTVTSGSSCTASAGASFFFNVTATGYPPPAISESGSLPSGVGFRDFGTGTAQFYGTPAVGTNGTYPVTLTVSNGIGSAVQQQFVLTVTASGAGGAARRFSVLLAVVVRVHRGVAPRSM